MRNLIILPLALPLMLGAQRLVPAGPVLQPVQPNSVDVVHDMAEAGGYLVIAGRFAGMNGVAAPNVLAWDGGTEVLDLGQPYPNGRIYVLEPYLDGVAMGGLGMLPNHVLYWNGSTTVALGGHIVGMVRDLATYGGELHAAARFDEIDEGDTSRVARWNGTDWVPLGNGFNDDVKALEVHEGVLYAGGDFSASADGVQLLPGIARWDGFAWQPVGPGLNGDVLELMSTPEGLWIGGEFTATADGAVEMNHYASTDGATIVPLLDDGAGELLVRGMLVNVPGYGHMVRADGQYSRYRAGGVWRSAITRGIYCAAAFQGEVYVGGEMEGMGHAPVNQSIGLAKVLPGSGEVELSVSGIKAFLRPDGCLFYDRQTAAPGFKLLDAGGASAVYAHGQYVVGYLGDSALTSCFTPFASGEDHVPGPRADGYAEPYTDRYQRTWPVDIGLLWEHAANAGQGGYQVPEVIANWPATGDQGNGEPALIAPFQDADGDGQYEPEEGDSPLIQGDRAVLLLDNDHAADTLPEIYPSQFDSRIEVFGFDEPQDSALWRTLFIRYVFTNRSGYTYDSVVVALATDADIGCASDDFIGCDPLLDMYYFYNWDDIDESCNGQLGFSASPPALGITGLNQSMRTFMSYSRNGPSCCNDPSTTTHAANYANGIWKDGSPQINTITGLPTQFMYTDYPDVPGGFHEVNQTNPDRRGIASFGPYFNVAPNETICLDVAFVFARDTTQDNIQNTRVLQDKVIALRSWYDAHIGGCGNYPSVGYQPRSFVADVLTIVPNPANDLVRVLMPALREDAELTAMDASGRIVVQHRVAAGQGEERLDVGAWPAGVFTLRLAGGTGVRTGLLAVIH